MPPTEHQRPAYRTQRASCALGGAERRPQRPGEPDEEDQPDGADNEDDEREPVGVLDGKAAIVTGSARGIGRATAELLTEHGARVLINDLDGDVAEQAASEIRARPRSSPAT